jgi:hypothetical protein
MVGFYFAGAGAAPPEVGLKEQTAKSLNEMIWQLTSTAWIIYMMKAMKHTPTLIKL